MGGFFGVAAKDDCVFDLFFGIDYHSHLGTRRGGMTVYGDKGFDRSIHNIENAPFRTKFDKDMQNMKGYFGIGCISDYEPQPLIVRSHHGTYALTTVSKINNVDEISKEIFDQGHSHFLEMSGGDINSTELVAFCASFENFAYKNLGYHDYKELGPGEVVVLTPSNCVTLVQPGKDMKICTFLWVYYGYPASSYEGMSVEQMRYNCGASMAKRDNVKPDIVAGVPDSGTAHAVGYANESGIPFSRPFIKYTPTWPRSFMPTIQSQRNLIAKMKLLAVEDLIKDKSLLLIDDSIVRGTQLRETTEYLFDSGAKEVHIRPACPPLVYGCKYLNFSRSSSEMDLITRRVIERLENGNVTDEVLQEYTDPDSEKYEKMVDEICKELHFTSLRFNRLDDMLEACGVEKCKLCTYCWDGKE